ncbi:UDP-2,3-diacylglucosamine diphosphatase [Natronospira bacteriovora]|uniref:UDP-2,3-diacylglucosamine hydrolase n=1 Tax=Natronospira bacteriovora TaxID=3069753 RepID=A0ABU0W4I1_9GAMM|nr:UDP-2,3-diacylglucosamine diphosphatase [Natronospira sp. AB-CW4]MDQ2068934.1 UDP-2,3-diacylglucosamine diphosphatase [Natronospira sp. AB-CW4]
MSTLFISDLHLHTTRPEITRLFLDFLQGEAREAEALYILGDLFEAWIGDDAASEHDQAVIAGMKALTDSGVPGYFMRGNRDFLIGERFARETGFSILPDPTTVTLYGEPVLLMHGDSLCIDDHDYMAFQQVVRSEAWQQDFLSKPIEDRIAFARKAREESAARGKEKSMEIMDVNKQEVKKSMAAAGVRRFIHGHTHRPAIHDIEVNGEPAQRIVLGDWYEQGSVLRVNAGGYDLRSIPLEA